MVKRVLLLLYAFLPGLDLYGLVGDYKGMFVFEASRDNYAFVANFTPLDQVKSISVNGNQVTIWSTSDCLSGSSPLDDLSPSITDSVLQVKHLLQTGRNLLTSVHSKPEIHSLLRTSDFSELKRRLAREVFSVPMEPAENGGLFKVMSHANGLVIFIYIDQQVLMKPVNCLNQFEEDLLASCVARLDEHRKYVEEWNHYKAPEGQTSY